MERSELLAEGVVTKFLRYVQVDSPSDPEGEGVPSTPEQWKMARLLAGELEAMGLPEIEVDRHAIVTATLPAKEGPTIGLIAHFDTYFGVPGRGVRPLIHREYGGGPIELPAGPVLRPEEHPALLRVVGSDVITSDGSTLLGADDKAGVAEIMEAVCRILREGRPHVPLRIAFTPDEEIGRGVQEFDVRRFRADFAYTLDGSELGELQSENFNAQNLRIRLRGRSTHTGTARGKMINACQLAAELIAALPAAERPETTDGRQGFYHADEVKGNVEAVEVLLLLRDFSREGLDRRRRAVEELLRNLELRYPGAGASLGEVLRYENMRDRIDAKPEILDRARRAMRATGIEPKETPIRGGTDGARLAAMGLPTPNLFTGGMNFHSRTEWIPVVWMEKAVEVVLRLVEP